VDNSKYGLMRDLSLNAPVKIELPAHVWAGYLSAYGAADWGCADADAIRNEVQTTLFDPRWLREQQAENQRQRAEHPHIHGVGIIGFPGPQVPPDAGGLSEDD
jgi:hypothetical protein